MPFCGKPLMNIINTCILENVFPDLWKKSVIIPIPKKTNPTNQEDFRPISILPVVSKIVERHICNQVITYTDLMKIIPDCQSGFRKNFSTTTCLVKLINDIRLSQEMKETTCLSLLDFSKAFDTLNHNLLLAKLHYFGLSEQSVNFLRAYLTQRSHCVGIKKDFSLLKSPYTPMTAGVPQGSILGPLLFSLYVADMNDELSHSKLQQYADDSQLYLSFTNENYIISNLQYNIDINRIDKFATDHNLKLNTSKSCVLFFESSKARVTGITKNFKVEINNVLLPVVAEAKNLGIHVDSKLTFNSHIKNKLTNAYCRLKKLNIYKKFLPPFVKYYLCNTLILSLFDYGDIVYDASLSAGLAKSIQKIQNSCMRFSFNIPYRHHITPYLNSNSILSMCNRRKCHMLSFIYKVLKTGKPPYLNSLFNSHEHSYFTRNVNNFKVPQHRTAAFQRSFSFVAIQLWHQIPKCVQELSYEKFVNSVKSIYLEQQKQNR